MIKIWRPRPESKPNQQARKRGTTSLVLFSWRHPCLQLSSPPASLLVASLTCITLSWHLSGLPSCLTIPSPSLWGGTVCFWRFVYGGRNTPLFQAASSLSSSRGTWQPSVSLVLRWAVSPVPMGSQNFLPGSLLLELHFKTADQYHVRKQTLSALDCVHKHCAILLRCGLRLCTNSVHEELMFHWMQWFLNIFFLHTVYALFKWKFSINIKMNEP